MAVGVICEFNPFHNGHRYLLETARKKIGEPVIVVISGSFTQRGEVAVTDKFSRAKTALQNGADLVLELPTVFAVANAERFAKCGTEILEAFDCMNYLAFGCETDDISLLLKASNAAQNDEVKKRIADKMKCGGYYPQAFESAVREVLGNETADVLKTPNNVLAVEYLRKLDRRISPLPIKRKGAQHDSLTADSDIASATLIRERLRCGREADEFYPQSVSDITFPENLERAVLYRLRSMSAEEIAELPDVKEGLENRIFNAVRKYNSINEIISEIKTKRYTHARIRRIITSALLNITEEMQTRSACYARVLGFSSVGAELLKDCRLPVITSVKSGLALGKDISEMLERDIFATDISALAYEIPKPCGADFTTPIVKV